MTPYKILSKPWPSHPRLSRLSFVAAAAPSGSTGYRLHTFIALPLGIVSATDFYFRVLASIVGVSVWRADAVWLSFGGI
jgi:hypothetical protein